jgi:Putative heavy-metal-binding
LSVGLAGRHPTRTSSHVSASSVRALIGVGFHPVGVVIGNSSIHIARPVALGTKSRLNTMARSFQGDAGEAIPAAIRHEQGDGDERPPGSEPPYLATYPCPHVANRPALRGQRLTDHFPGYTWELPRPGRSFTDCFHQALARLAARAVARGAHGVVDIRMGISGDELFQGNMEITLTGTAVACPTVPPLEKPFTAGVSCQGFAKLVTTGLIPVQFTLGAVVLSSWIGCQSRSELESGFSTSVVQLGDALTQARDTATALMWKETDLAEAPFAEVTVSHAQRKASKTDYRSAAWSSGTVVQRFSPANSGDVADAVLKLEQR